MSSRMLFVDTIIDILNSAYPDSEDYWLFVVYAGALWRGLDNPASPVREVGQSSYSSQDMLTILQGLPPDELYKLGERTWFWLKANGEPALKSFLMLHNN